MVTPSRISKSPGFISTLFLLLFEMTFDMGKKRPKKKRMYVRENSSTRSVYGLKEPPTTVKTKYSTYFIYSNKDKKVRLRQVNRNIWFCLGFLSESSMIFPIRTHQMSSEAREKSKDPNVSDEKMKRMAARRQTIQQPEGRKKKKRDFFSGSAFRKSNRTQSHPLSHSHDKKKRKKIRRNLKKREIPCGTLKMN